VKEGGSKAVEEVDGGGGLGGPCDDVFLGC
jgi:hypothetical protein